VLVGTAATGSCIQVSGLACLSAARGVSRLNHVVNAEEAPETSGVSAGILTRVITQQILMGTEGRAIAQAVSRWLPTGQGSRPFRSCGICGGQSGTGAGFLQVLRFPCQSSFHQMLHLHSHPREVQ
jgi:hypothetical protein